MINNFLKINNDELQEILNYVEKQPIFFGEGMRLLSEEEIENYKEELNIEIDDIIPLIDLYDNNFLIYNIRENNFSKMYIVDEIIFDETDTIKEYLELLRKIK